MLAYLGSYFVLLDTPWVDADAGGDDDDDDDESEDSSRDRTRVVTERTVCSPVVEGTNREPNRKETNDRP